MTEHEPTSEEIVDAIHAFAAHELQRGVPNGQVQLSLIERGLDHELAAAVVANLRQAEKATTCAAGKQNLMYGGLWCILGIAVSIVSRASASGGGMYFVAWGAIVFGGIQLLRGVTQCNHP